MPMSILKYFKKTELPDPKSSPLSAVIAPSAIAAANKELKALLNENSNAKRGTRGRYNR